MENELESREEEAPREGENPEETGANLALKLREAKIL